MLKLSPSRRILNLKDGIITKTFKDQEEATLQYNVLRSLGMDCTIQGRELKYLYIEGREAFPNPEQFSRLLKNKPVVQDTEYVPEFAEWFSEVPRDAITRDLNYEPEILCHADINRSNIILTPEGSWDLIDWEHCFRGPENYDWANYFYTICIYQSPKSYESVAERILPYVGEELYLLSYVCACYWEAHKIKVSKIRKVFMLSDVRDLKQWLASRLLRRQ